MAPFTSRPMPESANAYISGDDIDGFALYPGIFTPEEQGKIIQRIEDLRSKNVTTTRLVLRGDISDSAPWIREIAQKIYDLHILSIPSDLYQILRYEPSDKVDLHYDGAQFGGEIPGLSLGGITKFRLEISGWMKHQFFSIPKAPEGTVDNRKMEATLPPGSVYVMRNEARWGAKHATTPIDAVRYSITFRTKNRQNFD